MPRRRKPSSAAVRRVCPICGYETRPLTDKEWRADRPLHEASEQHQQALRRVGDLLAAPADPGNRRQVS